VKLYNASNAASNNGSVPNEAWSAFSQGNIEVGQSIIISTTLIAPNVTTAKAWFGAIAKTSSFVCLNRGSTINGAEVFNNFTLLSAPSVGFGSEETFAAQGQYSVAYQNATSGQVSGYLDLLVFRTKRMISVLETSVSFDGTLAETSPIPISERLDLAQLMAKRMEGVQPAIATTNDQFPKVPPLAFAGNSSCPVSPLTQANDPPLTWGSRMVFTWSVEVGMHAIFCSNGKTVWEGTPLNDSTVSLPTDVPEKYGCSANFGSTIDPSSGEAAGLPAPGSLKQSVPHGVSVSLTYCGVTGNHTSTLSLNLDACVQEDPGSVPWAPKKIVHENIYERFLIPAKNRRSSNPNLAGVIYTDHGQPLDGSC